MKKLTEKQEKVLSMVTDDKTERMIRFIWEMGETITENVAYLARLYKIPEKDVIISNEQAKNIVFRWEEDVLGESKKFLSYKGVTFTLNESVYTAKVGNYECLLRVKPENGLYVASVKGLGYDQNLYYADADTIVAMLVLRASYLTFVDSQNS